MFCIDESRSGEKVFGGAELVAAAAPDVEMLDGAVEHRFVRRLHTVAVFHNFAAFRSFGLGTFKNSVLNRLERRKCVFCPDAVYVVSGSGAGLRTPGIPAMVFGVRSFSFEHFSFEILEN